MNTRVLGTPVRRARKRSSRLATMAVIASSALALSMLPAVEAFADDPKPASAWGKDAPRFTMPEVKVGSTKPVPPEAEKAPTAELAAWRKAQKERRPEPQLAVEDMADEWNGPLPSFLSVSAG